MTIRHFKKTNIAEAPDELSECINKYTKHSSKVDKSSLSNSKYDVLNHHNRVWKGDSFPFDKPSIMQFHSEPEKTDVKKYLGPKLVVAQYQATLKEYAPASMIRNILDFPNEDMYPMFPIRELRIAYSPSVANDNFAGSWYDKGYGKTVEILNMLSEKYPSLSVDIIAGVSRKEALQRKAQAAIVIDECATGSYHRSALEGLALGKVTIAYMNNAVKDVFLRASGSDTVPIRSVALDGLYDYLSSLITNYDLEYFRSEGERNRNWMETYWSPKSIVEQYIDFYEYAVSVYPKYRNLFANEGRRKVIRRKVARREPPVRRRSRG